MQPASRSLPPCRCGQRCAGPAWHLGCVPPRRCAAGQCRRCGAANLWRKRHRPPFQRRSLTCRPKLRRSLHGKRKCACRSGARLCLRRRDCRQGREKGGWGRWFRRGRSGRCRVRTPLRARGVQPLPRVAEPVCRAVAPCRFARSPHAHRRQGTMRAPLPAMLFSSCLCCQMSRCLRAARRQAGRVRRRGRRCVLRHRR